jgi:hypothetical protein
MDSAQMQQLEDRPPITIKFAQLQSRSARLVPDAFGLYQDLFADLPSGWVPAGEAQLNTRTDSLRPAHAFSHPDVEDEILTVEHETGVEFLLMGLVAPLAAAAVQGFVRWSFKKWKHQQDLAAGSVTPRTGAALGTPAVVLWILPDAS